MDLRRWFKCITERGRAFVDEPQAPSGAEMRGEAAASLAAVLFSQRSWQLRKVESRLFREGAYSVTRVSIDCVPQALPALRYTLTGPGAGPGRGEARVLVPITFMQKGPLRSFDMQDSAGRPMPVIGRSEYSQIMTDMLLYELRDAMVENEDEQVLQRALTTVLDADRPVAEAVAEDLVVDGTYRGVQCVRPEEITNYAANLILALADSYVLIALLPESQAGSRQVIKYGHHSTEQLETRGPQVKGSWIVKRLAAVQARLDIRAGPVRRFRLAAGLEALRVEFDLSHPAGSASHHFEMVVPDGLRCERLKMPVVQGSSDRNTVDTTPTGVAHAVATYVVNPSQGVEVEFRVPFHGLRQRAALACFVTGAILLLGLLLPGAQSALLRAGGGAAALLLAVPAIVVALAVGSGEHVMVARMLSPLRIIVVGCGALLLACAGSIVGVLHDEWRYPLWWLGALGAMTTALTLAWTAIRAYVGRLIQTGGNARRGERAGT